MSNIFITIFAYFIDKYFGDFNFIKHPVIYIRKMISFFEERYYKKEILRGIYLVVFMLGSASFIALLLEEFLSYLTIFLDIIFSSVIASVFISHRILYDSIKEVIIAKNKNSVISVFVGRDAQNMSESDIYKTAIETYAESLNDGVIAPMFYLLFFGLPGIIVYKTLSTMDSIVGYKNPRYEKYGKATALLDDVFNYIPSRLTAVLIMLLSGQKDLFVFYVDGKKHDSPNAGHPIAAMAFALGVKLGGTTHYFGKTKKKPYFGKGRKNITEDDVKNALNIGKINI